MVAGGCDPPGQPDNTQELPQLRKQLEEVQQQLKDLHSQLDQQTAVLHRALGKAVPILVPEGTLKQFKSLEDRFVQPADWPETLEGAEKLRQELEQLVKRHVPPWAEEELLPRLNVLRWNVRVIWLLRHHTSPSPEQAEELAEEYRSLIAGIPDGASSALKGLLQTQRVGMLDQVNTHHQSQALAQARKALDGKGELLAALGTLEGNDQPQAGDLRDQLRRTLLDQDTTRKLTLLESTLDSAATLPKESLRRTSLLKVEDAAASLLLDLYTEKPPRKEMQEKANRLVEQCDAQIKDLFKQQQEAQEKRDHDYQAWALEQILLFDGDDGWHYDKTLPWIQAQLRSFKNAEEDRPGWVLFKEFPSTKELFQALLGLDLSDIKNAELSVAKQQEIYKAASSLTGWVKNIDQEIAYRVTRDGMVKYLLPINTNLLEPPVAQLYNKAFKNGWEKLAGRQDQLYVAKQSAIVKKKTP